MTEDEFFKVIISNALQTQVSHYGIEGLEDAIKRNYANNIIARDRILEVYYKMYKIGEKNV